MQTASLTSVAVIWKSLNSNAREDRSQLICITSEPKVALPNNACDSKPIDGRQCQLNSNPRQESELLGMGVQTTVVFTDLHGSTAVFEALGAMQVSNRDRNRDHQQDFPEMYYCWRSEKLKHSGTGLAMLPI